MKSVFVVFGPCGSGKSTIAKYLATIHGFQLVEGDCFHSDANVKKMAAGIPLNDTDREGWLRDVAISAVAALNVGSGAIVACSALKQKYRDVFRTIVNCHNDREHEGIRLHFVYLQMSEVKAKTLVEIRAKAEGHFMPSGLVHSQYETLEVPIEEKDCVVVDADMSVEDVKYAAALAINSLTRSL